jgi:uncharacterized protein involved in exopolysaccharide biosynthesis
LIELAENIDIDAAQRLKEATVTHLQQDQWRHINQRAELQQKIRDELKQILADCRNDYENPIYLRFEAAARTAIQTLKTN